MWRLFQANILWCIICFENITLIIDTERYTNNTFALKTSLNNSHSYIIISKKIWTSARGRRDCSTHQKFPRFDLAEGRPIDTLFNSSSPSIVLQECCRYIIFIKMDDISDDSFERSVFWKYYKNHPSFTLSFIRPLYMWSIHDESMRMIYSTFCSSILRDLKTIWEFHF